MFSLRRLAILEHVHIYSMAYSEGDVGIMANWFGHHCIIPSKAELFGGTSIVRVLSST